MRGTAGPAGALECSPLALHMSGALDPDISRTCSDYRSWRTEGFGRRTPLQRLTQPNYEVNRSTR